MKFAASLFSLLLLAALGLAQSAQGVTIYDANATFLNNETPNGFETNPFGQFSAGQTAGLGGAFSLISNHSDTFNGNANIEGYFIASAFLVPAVLINTSSTSVSTNFGVTLEPSEILMHPDASTTVPLSF